MKVKPSFAPNSKLNFNKDYRVINEKTPWRNPWGFFLYKKEPLVYNIIYSYEYKYSMVNNQAGKGSKRRPTDEDQYRDNYDKIFNVKKKKTSKKKKIGKK